MLTGLSIRNFRGFSNHEIDLSKVSVLVGRNNAGKSTLVESLRLVSTVAGKYQSLNFTQSPPWLELPAAYRGVSPSLKGLEINFDNLFYRYGDPPAEIEANFSGGERLHIFLENEKRIYAVVYNSKKKVVKTRQEAKQCSIPAVGIMPQVAPVQKKEITRNADYIRKSVSSYLAPSHFRNQINVYHELFPKFQEVVEETWPGVQVIELVGRTNMIGEELHLEVRNEDFVAEIHSMGHGLQMWLQTMWFVTRSQGVDTIILDEPDVYMHADLQRRIIRYLKNNFKQVIIATHSVEIMSEVSHEEILIVDKRAQKSSFASSLPAVQTLIDNVGSVHNLHLVRLSNAKRFLFIEGKDIKFLKQFQNTLFPDSDSPVDMVPNMSIGGWGGWNYAVGSSLTLKNAIGEDIATYCILDSDYHTEDSIEGRREEAYKKGVFLHVWKYKEIENYLLNPNVIQRYISKQVPRRLDPPSVDEVFAKIRCFAEEVKDIVFDGLSAEILSETRSLGVAGANKKARTIMKERESEVGLVGVVSGKNLISRLSNWSQEDFGVSFSALALSKEMKSDEIPDEVKHVITAIESISKF